MPVSKNMSLRKLNIDHGSGVSQDDIVEHIITINPKPKPSLAALVFNLGHLKDLTQDLVRVVKPRPTAAVSRSWITQDLVRVVKPRPTAAGSRSWIKTENRLSAAAAAGIRKKRDLNAWDRGRVFSKHYKNQGMPQPITYAQHARHSVLLMSNVLNVRTNSSPFTLVLDDLNQSAEPLLTEVTRRALSRNVNVVVISFERKRVHPAVRVVPGWGPQTGKQILGILENAMQDYKESVVIIDSLHDLLVTKGVDMNTLFQLVAVNYNSILFGVYHTDFHNQPNMANPYAPQPLDLVKYLATTILTCHSFAQVIADKRAKERSVAAQLYGIGNEAEGVVQALTANTPAGMVLAAEFRRRSGRSEHEMFFLRPSINSDYNVALGGLAIGTLKLEFVTLLNGHPAYRQQPAGRGSPFGNGMTDEMISTFNLELTAKQKEVREGVILPYFDAQKEGGGEGGRILYEMGAEDDFDEEEDEI